MAQRLARLAGALTALLVVAGLAPAVAEAHGIVGKADLPIPVWLFSWAAALVLVVSFVALSTLWTAPRLQREYARRLLRLPRRLEPLLCAFGLAMFALVVYSGFSGAQVPNANFSVTFIYVAFWVGTPLASVLIGDFFPPFSPWRSTARLLRWIARPLAGERHLRLPGAVGSWPALCVLVGFGWLELVYLGKDVPSTLAALSLGYFAVSTVGMALFGVDEWGQAADGFGLYFHFSSLASAVVYRSGQVRLRRPLSGLPHLRVGPGTVFFISAMIGITTFDGFSNGGYWKELYPEIASLFKPLGVGHDASYELSYSVGLVACVLVVRLVYALGIRGVHSVSDQFDRAQLTRTFAHTLVPIALGYVLAHYFSFIVWQGQALGNLISDPLGNGSNYLGTAGAAINYKVISYALIWYVQVAALLAGHVGGLALAHDRALAIYDDREDAVRSQYWMLAVMVAFTSFGLWILSAVGT